MADTPPPDLAEAGWPSLATSERSARRMVEGGAGIGRRMLTVLMAEFDRRGTADVDHWRARALEAEARVDGQAWADLEAERDKLRQDVVLWKAVRDELLQDLADLRAARSTPGAPPPEVSAAFPPGTPRPTCSTCGVVIQSRPYMGGWEHSVDGCYDHPASPGAPTRAAGAEGVAAHEAPRFFADAMREHGRCCCGVDADGAFCGDCALCSALPFPEWPCPTIDHSGYPLPAPASPEASAPVSLVQQAIASARLDGVPAEAFDDLTRRLLACVASGSLTGDDAATIQVALAARPPLSSPPVQEHPAPSLAGDVQATADLGVELGDSGPAKPQAEPSAGMTFCDARISPSWSNRWVRCGSLVSNGRCISFGHGPAPATPQSSPGVPPTGRRLGPPDSAGRREVEV